MPGPRQQRQIVGHVPEGDRRVRGHPARGAERRERCGLVHVGGRDLDEGCPGVGDGGAGPREPPHQGEQRLGGAVGMADDELGDRIPAERERVARQPVRLDERPVEGGVSRLPPVPLPRLDGEAHPRHRLAQPGDQARRDRPPERRVPDDRAALQIVDERAVAADRQPGQALRRGQAAQEARGAGRHKHEDEPRGPDTRQCRAGPR